MRVGIDARLGLSGGIDRYILRLVTYLSRIDRRNSYHVYVTPSEGLRRLEVDASADFRLVPLDHAKYHPLAPLMLGRRIRDDRIQVFHALSYWMVPVFPKCALVTTVHDTLALAGSANSVAGGLYGKVANRCAARNSSVMITVSDYTKSELARYFPAYRDKMTTVHHGIGAEFRPEDPAGMDDDLERYGLRRAYLLYVGSLKSNKNIDRMIEAYALLPRGLREKHPLVCVGGAASDRVAAVLARCGLEPGTAVRFVPYIEKEATLRSLYRGASAVIMPSLFEYFGFPLVEAMACDVPVVCSDSSCMREIAAEAALYFDPLAPKDMAAGLVRILTDDRLRAGLTAAGRENVKRFTWEETARRVVEIYERVGHA